MEVLCNRLLKRDLSENSYRVCRVVKKWSKEIRRVKTQDFKWCHSGPGPEKPWLCIRFRGSEVLSKGHTG